MKTDRRKVDPGIVQEAAKILENRFGAKIKIGSTSLLSEPDRYIQLLSRNEGPHATRTKFPKMCMDLLPIGFSYLYFALWLANIFTNAWRLGLCIGLARTHGMRRRVLQKNLDCGLRIS